MGIALAAAGIAAAAPASATPASTDRYEDALAAYQRNDFDKSLKLLRPLAEKGDARAQYLMGRHYQFGQAVKADRAEAFFWYKRAEAKGHLEAKLFRQLLEKRWKITADERGRAGRKLAAQNAPKPPPEIAAGVREFDVLALVSGNQRLGAHPGAQVLIENISARMLGVAHAPERAFKRGETFAELRIVRAGQHHQRKARGR